MRNLESTVSSPTRRTALGGMIAAAAGLVVAPRGEAATAKKTKHIVEPSSRAALGYDDGDEPLTPALARLKAESQAILLPACWELTDALAAVLELHYGDRDDGDCGHNCEWCAACDGLWYTVDIFVSLIGGEVKIPLWEKSQAERARRKKAFKAGKTHSGCPVAWADFALKQLQEALEWVEDAFDQAKGSSTELATDCHYFAWQVRELRSGFDNEYGVRMSEAARDAWRRSPETQREIKAMLAKIEA
jgi:hypothetical protein